ncbi:MAG: lipoprotein [Steroidobacteraceae bacterium]
MNSPTGRLCLRLAATVAALLGAASCGQKGPLYLPDPAPQTVPAAADRKTDTGPGTAVGDEASGAASSDPAKRENPTAAPPEGSGPGRLL